MERNKKNKFFLKQQIAPYLFVLPYFVIFLAFSVFPIFYSVFISFHEWDGVSDKIFVGLTNYMEVIKDARLLKALTNTLLFMVMIIPIQIVSGFLMAVVLSNKFMPIKKVYRLLIFLPYLTTPIALGVIFGILFDSNFGMVNYILEFIGLNGIKWTTEAVPAKFLVALVTIWRYAGYTAVLFMAGITKINSDLYEACEIDGGNFWKCTRYITIPLLKPVTIFVVITTIIGCFQIFEEPYMIFSAVAGKTVGGPDNAVLTGLWYFYDTAFRHQMRFGYGAAIGMTLFVVIAIISFVANKLLHGKEDK
ncbi:MAG: sugar ABC transporter permease [Clostridium sp.]|nr:sugar ABC transporter permease [Clostridium sp.]